MPVSEHYRPSTRFLELGEGFADPVAAARFPQQILRYRNDRWDRRVGLGDLTDDEWRTHFGSFQPLPESLPTPLALRYHGHQFLNYNPDLGDGRGFLFAQLIDTAGQPIDIGTKGSGQTPHSHGSDGRLTLKGGVREVLATEMLEALGVKTSKSLSLFETGESLTRHDEPSPARSSVLVRLHHGLVRVGTFQRCAHLQEFDRLKTLLDYSVEHYVPEADEHAAGRVQGFLDAVVTRSADLAASWMAAGFVHGVLNTDNTNITGESFEYGPYRFLPTYDSGFVAADFDYGGLYAFGRQPHAVLWNLIQLAEALQNIEEEVRLTESLPVFEERFAVAFLDRFLERLGVEAAGEEHDIRLTEEVIGYLEASGLGYERFFFDWYGGSQREPQALDGPEGQRYADPAFSAVRSALERYSPRQPSLPTYFSGAGPCTLLIDEVEAIWSAIQERDDWRPFNAKIEAIRAFGDAVRSPQTPPA